jgi:hypothetical protein
MGAVPKSIRSPIQVALEARSAVQQTGGLTGTVVLAPDSVPLTGVEVSLHVITADSGGVVATSVSDETGRFRFEVDPSTHKDPESTVYLLTTRYQDVMYVGDALHRLPESESELSIVVFESRPVGSLPLTKRRTVVQVAGGVFELLDVFELVNDSDFTLVRAPDAESGWEVALPSGAGRTASASIGFGSGSYELYGDRVLFDLSVPPGGRTFSVRYRLSGPLVRLVLDRPLVEQLVFVEEGAGVLVEGLTPAGTTELEGKRFARFSGANLQAGDASTLRLTAVASPKRYAWMALSLGVVLAAAALVGWRLAARTPAP